MTKLQVQLVPWCAVLMFLLAGCSDIPPKAAPVVPERARTALVAALDTWQAGQSIESLASATPAIVVQDFDWMQGKQLVSYQIEGDGESQDANLRIDVELELSEGGGKSATKRVSYIVGTDPSLTVFRSFD
jgi:hypothetical protein